MHNLVFNIVSTNNKQLLRKCLNSILKNIILKDYEIWVIDNCSQDGTTEMLKEEFPQVKAIRNNKRFSNFYNHNLIFKNVSANYYMVMSEDVQIRYHAIKGLLEIFKTSSNVGMVGAKTLYPDGSIQNCNYINYPNLLTEAGRVLWFPRFIKRIFPDKEWSWDLWPGTNGLTKDREFATVNGCCFMVKAEAVDKIGLMDAHYGHYYGDVDFMYRVKKAGWRIFYITKA